MGGLPNLGAFIGGGKFFLSARSESDEFTVSKTRTATVDSRELVNGNFCLVNYLGKICPNLVS